MTSYTKLFSDILASTIWNESPETKVVWITMLAMADRDGVVGASLPGLAHIARVSVPACSAALATLAGPDEHSRTKDADGRRIEAIDGGWRILNYEKHRERSTKEEKREKDAERQRRKRERDAKKNGVTPPVTPPRDKSRKSPDVAHAEADAEADADTPLRPAGPDDGEHPSCCGPSGQQDDRAAASGAAGPSRIPEERALYEALKKSTYRRNARDREAAMVDAAARLDAAGITPGDLDVLAQKAMRRKGVKKPGGIFAHWIDHVDEAIKELGKR